MVVSVFVVSAVRIEVVSTEDQESAEKNKRDMDRFLGPYPYDRYVSFSPPRVISGSFYMRRDKRRPNELSVRLTFW